MFWCVILGVTLFVAPTQHVQMLPYILFVYSYATIIGLPWFERLACSFLSHRSFTVAVFSDDRLYKYIYNVYQSTAEAIYSLKHTNTHPLCY